MEKIKAIDPKIVVSGSADKPYYFIECYDTSDNQWHIGYGSYELKNVIEWLKTDFEIVEADVEPVRYGCWVETIHKGYKCSLCNCLSSLFDENLKSEYCPWCGAKMDGEPNNAT